jgi:hypothetical protein
MRKRKPIAGLNQSLRLYLEESQATLCERHRVPTQTYKRWQGNLLGLLESETQLEDIQILQRALKEREREIEELKEQAYRRW